MRADATSFFAPSKSLPRAPWWSWLLVLLLLVPLMNGVLMSVSQDGREAFAFWWRDARGWIILARSVGFAAMGAGVGTLAGAAIAMLLPLHRAMLSRIVIVICCLPLLVPSSLMGVGWIMAMGRDAVITNFLRHALGDWTPTVYTWPVAAGATGLRYFGVAALIIFAARSAGAELYAVERVFVLGWRVRLRLHLGALSRPIGAAFVILVLLVQSDHILPSMFLVHTFGTEILIQFNALMNPAGAAALAIVPTGLSIILAMLTAQLLRAEHWFTRRRSDDLASRRTIISDAVIVLLLLAAMGVPLCGVALRAGNIGNLVTAWQQSRDEAFKTLWLAGIGALLAIAPAVVVAHAWTCRRRAGDGLAVVLANIAVPGSLLALGCLSLPWPRKLLDSDVPLMCAYAARFAPIAIITMAIAWSRISPLANLAARVHGVSTLTRVRRVLLPPRFAGLSAAYLLVALLIAAELEISLILVQPGPTTLGVRLYTLIHTAPDYMVAALAMDLMLIVLLLVTLLLIALRIARYALVRGAR